MPLPRARDRDGVDGPARSPLARLLTVIAWVGILPQAAAQTLPAGAGYQIGDGAIPALGPRRGIEGGATDVSFTAQATLTNNANYGASNVRQGDLILEFIPALELPPRGGAAARRRLRLARLPRLCRRHAGEQHPAAGQHPGEPRGDRQSVLRRWIDLGRPVGRQSVPAALGVLVDQQPVHVRRKPASRRTSRATSATTRPGWSAATTPTRGLRSPTIRSAMPTTAGNSPKSCARRRRSALTLRLTNDITRIEDQLQPDQMLNTALAIVDYAFTPQLTLGLRGGYETRPTPPTRSPVRSTAATSPGGRRR